MMHKPFPFKKLSISHKISKIFIIDVFDSMELAEIVADSIEICIGDSIAIP
jgi:hypothetical protein